MALSISNDATHFNNDVLFTRITKVVLLCELGIGVLDEFREIPGVVVWIIVFDSHVTSREGFQPVALRGAELECLNFAFGHIEHGIRGEGREANVSWVG